MRGTAIAAAVAISFLAGCAAPGQTALSTGTEAGRIEVRDDKYQPYLEFRSLRARLSQYPNLIGLQLIGRRDRRSGAVTALLHVEFAYVALRRRKYRSARNAKGEILRVTPISAGGRCNGKSACPLDEVFTIDLPAPALRLAGTSGYHLKIFGKTGGDTELIIPKTTIAELFARLDANR